MSLSPNSSDETLSLSSQVMRAFCEVPFNVHNPISSPHCDCIHILMNLSFVPEAWFKFVHPKQFSQQLLNILDLSFQKLLHSSNMEDPFSSSATLNGLTLDIALAPAIYLIYNLAQSDGVICVFIRNEIFPETGAKKRIGNSLEKLMTHPGQSRLRVVIEDLVFLLFDKKRESVHVKCCSSIMTNFIFNL